MYKNVSKKCKKHVRVQNVSNFSKLTSQSEQTDLTQNVNVTLTKHNRAECEKTPQKILFKDCHSAKCKQM